MADLTSPHPHQHSFSCLSPCPTPSSPPQLPGEKSNNSKLILAFWPFSVDEWCARAFVPYSSGHLDQGARMANVILERHYPASWSITPRERDPSCRRTSARTDSWCLDQGWKEGKSSGQRMREDALCNSMETWDSALHLCPSSVLSTGRESLP